MADRVVSLKNMIFASDAETIIPPIPTAGTPYRNTEFDQEEAAQGWPFDSLVDSAQFNQYLYQLSNIVDQLERTGILLWCNQTDYIIGGICKDDTTGLYYEALDESGPNNGGAKQPSTNIGTYWKLAAFSAGNFEFVDATTEVLANDIIYCRDGAEFTLPTENLNHKDVVTFVAGSTITTGNEVVINGAIEDTDQLIIDDKFSFVKLIYDGESLIWRILEVHVSNGVYLV